MLFLDLNKSDIQEAKRIHSKHAKCAILRRLGSQTKCAEGNCWICDGQLQRHKPMNPNIKSTLDSGLVLAELLEAEPKDMERIEQRLYNGIFEGIDLQEIDSIKRKEKKKRTNEELSLFDRYSRRFNQLKGVVDYKGWFVGLEPTSEYSAYHLSAALNVRSCIYCNRTYTITQTTLDRKAGERKKLTRPQFDHWFSKEEHPLLGLSFFNLIPSCSICNGSVKGRTTFSLGSHVHPYVDNIGGLLNFSYEYRVKLEELKVKLTVTCSDDGLKKRIENTLKDLHIEDLYNGHLEELEDLIKIRQAYSKNYLSSLKQFFSDRVLSDEDIYRLAFGTEIREDRFQNRPMSKFKHDILKELKII